MPMSPDKQALDSRNKFQSSRSLWRSSLDKLAEVEARLFASAGVQTRSSFVPISFQNSQIYTVTLDPTEAPTTPSTSTAPLGQLTGTLASTDSTAEHPVVLVHGFGAGSAIWCANMAAITTRHIVHAIDLLGFGRSSRPKFSAKPEEAEQQMVDAIEEWRKQMGIQKMYLVGHSFGGYLSTSYALKYPERIEHLVLVDPWGYAEAEERQLSRRLTLIVGIISLFNPLTTLRVSGPFGPKLVKKARPDLGVRYPSENPDDIYEYIYRCNSQSPTGETAFKSMMAKLGWAKNPMLHRFPDMHEAVPVTFIHGGQSWISADPAYALKDQLPNNKINIHILENAHHHVYADARDEFNELVRRIISGERANSSEPRTFDDCSLADSETTDYVYANHKTN
ncbi:hypothetical protein WR25_26352 isoform C [Diploscapter pachys]|uniref:AB hydrolase-1 domain-containing protein n=1 Tax=Diploscapter pachys TaxID=2018661 RepID=A0A2A2JJE3_9BILA|nr:hypothetical protein WR25_26352 isoform C [Diploscapter pachys]